MRLNFSSLRIRHDLARLPEYRVLHPGIALSRDKERGDELVFAIIFFSLIDNDPEGIMTGQEEQRLELESYDPLATYRDTPTRK